MTSRQTLLWWAGVAASLAAVVIGIGAGALAYVRVSEVRMDQQLSPLQAVSLFAAMMAGLLLVYVILFTIWVAVCHALVGYDDLLSISGNTQYQSPASAKVNRAWVAFLARLLGLAGSRLPNQRL